MPGKLCERKIFLSSTIRNLQEERAAICARLQRPFEHVKFDIIASDKPETLHMSGDDLQTRGGYDPNLFILNQIRYADYYVILLNDAYYGGKISWTQKRPGSRSASYPLHTRNSGQPFDTLSRYSCLLTGTHGIGI